MADNLPHPSHRRRGKRWCRLIQDRDMRRLPLTRHPDMDLPFATARSRPIGNGARGYDTRNMNSAAGSLTLWAIGRVSEPAAEFMFLVS